MHVYIYKNRCVIKYLYLFIYSSYLIILKIVEKIIEVPKIEIVEKEVFIEVP